MANTLKQLIDYSKANPDSPVASKLQKAITAGAYDEQASQEGVDLSWAGRPKYEAPAEQPSAYEQKIVEPLRKFSTGVAKGVLETGRQVGKFGQEILQQTAGRVVEKVTGVSKEKLGNPIYEGETPEALKPEEGAETIGFATEKIAEFFTPLGVVSKGKAALAATEAPFLLRLLGNVALETGATTAVGALQGQNLEELETTAGYTAALEAAPGLVGALARSPAGKPIIKYLAEKIPSRLLNSIIRPVDKAFDFGKNPGLGVVEEGITANTRGGLLTKIGQKKTEVGQEIGRMISAPEIMAKQLDITNSILEPIKIAKQQALQSGERALFGRLDDIEKGFTELFIAGEKGIEPAGTKLLFGLTPKQAHELKINVGRATRWTGQAFDNDVNQVRVQIYRNLDRVLDEAIPGIEGLNKRYANLLTAEKNLEKTDKRMQRLIMSGLIPSVTGGIGFGAAIATGDQPLEAVGKGLLVGAGAKFAGSTPVKTRLAQVFSKLKPNDQEKVFRIIPALRNIVFGVEAVPEETKQTPNEE